MTVLAALIGLLPHAEAAAKGVFVGAQASAGREFFQFAGISAAQNHVIGFQRRFSVFR